ncbi:hypothetical protein PoB_003389500 [Plakobranchus ocellatus]|uniref:Uncharacterized protein n=1 Tax=Plakobranchus ocellatus TaxID=259542 RepID=A0AAV4AGS9_9GAST|nr:hypothetical protein PoB_003389500 [Plakobranchus ocellatus]
MYEARQGRSLEDLAEIISKSKGKCRAGTRVDSLSLSYICTDLPTPKGLFDETPLPRKKSKTSGIRPTAVEPKASVTFAPQSNFFVKI